MADVGVRELERRYCGSSAPADGLALASAQRRAGDVDGCFWTLSDLIGDDGRDVVAHQEAVVAFRSLLGDVWVDDSHSEYWRIAYVSPDFLSVDGRRFIVEDVDKVLLDGGRRHTQGEFRVLAQARGRQLQSLPEYAGQVRALYGVRNPLIADRVEAVRGALEVGMKRYQVLDSQTVWTPANQPDRFYAHGVGAQGTEIALAGPRGQLRNLAGVEGQSQVVFGTRDVGSVRDALRWIGGREPFMFRFEEREKANLDAEVERVVGLDVNVNGVLINLVVSLDGVGGVYSLGGVVARGWFRRCERTIL